MNAKNKFLMVAWFAVLAAIHYRAFSGASYPASIEGTFIVSFFEGYRWLYESVLSSITNYVGVPAVFLSIWFLSSLVIFSRKRIAA